MVEQAVHFATLAPNLHVKFPATSAGIVAMEEATASGVSINADRLSPSKPQQRRQRS
jgi:transaldolase